MERSFALLSPWPSRKFSNKLVIVYDLLMLRDGRVKLSVVHFEYLTIFFNNFIHASLRLNITIFDVGILYN
jgi:hypothetical protein